MSTKRKGAGRAKAAPVQRGRQTAEFVPCSAHRLPPGVPPEEVIAHALAECPQAGVWAMSAVALVGMPAEVPEPARIAHMVQKLFPAAVVANFPVTFIEGSAELRRKALHYFNLLSGGGAAVRFVESPQNGLWRVGFDPRDGHYSYIGTDCKMVAGRGGSKTMNLALGLNSPESEWLRVAPHEAGHGVGCPHEHNRPEIISRLDPEGCYAEFAQYGWSRSTVNSQVLTPPQGPIAGTPASVVSMMCYSFSGRCTRDRQPIPGGTKPTADDLAHFARLYPGGTVNPPPVASGATLESFIAHLKAGGWTLTPPAN